jgi:hypothetical protein
MPVLRRQNETAGLLGRFSEKPGGYGSFNFVLGLNDPRSNEENQLLV